MWIRGSETYSEEDFLTEIGRGLRDTSKLDVVVGADSQPFANGTLIVVAVCFLSPDKRYHGRCFHKKLPMLRPFMDLYSRVYAEMEASISVGQSLMRLYPSCPITIHLDVNSHPRGYTYRWSSGLVSIVKGYGFDRVETKPNAWCASCVADKYTKRFQ